MKGNIITACFILASITQIRILSEEEGRVRFNLATPTYSAIACRIHIVIAFINITHFKLFQKECTVALQLIFG